VDQDHAPYKVPIRAYMPINIGKTIQMIRLAKGLSLKDVATTAAISNPFLSLVESGERQPSLDVMRRISQALTIPVEALILISQPNDTSLKSNNAIAENIMASVKRLADAEEELRRQLKAEELQGDSIA